MIVNHTSHRKRVSGICTLLIALSIAALLLSGCSKAGEEEPKPAVAPAAHQSAGATQDPHAGMQVHSKATDDKGKKHFEKGIRFSLMGRYDDAIAEFKESLKSNPMKPAVHNNLGFAYLDKGDIDGAIRHQKKAIEMKPDFANAHYGLALALEKKNDKKGALESWQRFMELSDPQSKWRKRAKEHITRLKGRSQQ